MPSNSVLASMAVRITANSAQFAAEMTKLTAQTKSFQTGLTNLGSALGVTFGASTIYSGLRYGIGIIADFEASMSEVKAITMATGKEFEDLKKNALDLGAATKFTAKEVSQLQVAYGRLGFTTKEILNATKATLDLAAATGEDLAKSADVAGSTVRAFNFDASETQRVADVMAKSFNESALGLENFSEAMKYVAPVAANAGISLEQTTALLGVLADAGIRGSQAGTSLRKIISDLGQGAAPVLSKRLKEMAAAGLSGADAMDEVGRTAYTSLLVLSQNTAKVDKATESYKNATGAVSEMARIMQDNLTGDVTKLTSAFDGLILKLSGGTGILRDMTQGITSLINVSNNLPSISETLGLVFLVSQSGPAGLKVMAEYQRAIDNAVANAQKQKRVFEEFQNTLKLKLPPSELDGGIASQERTVDFLKGQIKILEDSTSGLSSRGAIAAVQGQIKVLTTELNNLLGVTDKAPKRLADFSQKIIDDAKRQTAELKAAYERLIDWYVDAKSPGEIKMPDFSNFMKNFKLPEGTTQQFGNAVKEVQQFQIDLSGAIMDLGQTFGEFFADLNNGAGNIEPFANRIKRLIGGLMQAVGGALIAFGSAKLALSFSINPAVAIGAGIALVAAGAALSKSANNVKKTLNGGGGGSGGGNENVRTADNFEAKPINIIINDGKAFQFELAGDTLVAATKKATYVRGRRG